MWSSTKTMIKIDDGRGLRHRRAHTISTFQRSTQNWISNAFFLCRCFFRRRFGFFNFDSYWMRYSVIVIHRVSRSQIKNEPRKKKQTEKMGTQSSGGGRLPINTRLWLDLLQHWANVWLWRSPCCGYGQSRARCSSAIFVVKICLIKIHAHAVNCFSATSRAAISCVRVSCPTHLVNYSHINAKPEKLPSPTAMTKRPATTMTFVYIFISIYLMVVWCCADVLV